MERCFHHVLYFIRQGRPEIEFVCRLCGRSTYVYPNELTDTPAYGVRLIGEMFGVYWEDMTRSIDWSHEFRRLAFQEIARITSE